MSEQIGDTSEQSQLCMSASKVLGQCCMSYLMLCMNDELSDGHSVLEIRKDLKLVSRLLKEGKYQ